MLCPECWHEVDTGITSCPHCGSEFRNFATRKRAQAIKRRRIKELERTLALATIFISISILFIYVNLPFLHERIQPIEKNLPQYLLAIGACIILAFILYRVNLKRNFNSLEHSSLRRVILSAIMIASGTATLLIIFAHDIDHMLSRQGFEIAGFTTIALLTGTIIFFKSSGANWEKGKIQRRNYRQ